MYFKKTVNLGIDIDGCLLDNFHVWKEYYNAHASLHNHSEIVTCNDSPNWIYFESICNECWRYVLHSEKMILSYEVLPIAKEVLTWLNDMGANLHIVSQRPDDVVEATKYWIADNFGSLFKTVNVVNNKLECCKQLGVGWHLDDAPHHIKAFQTQEEIIPIIYDHPYNNYLEGIRVKNWTEYCSQILNLTSKEKIKNG